MPRLQTPLPSRRTPERRRTRTRTTFLLGHASDNGGRSVREVFALTVYVRPFLEARNRDVGPVSTECRGDHQLGQKGLVIERIRLDIDSATPEEPEDSEEPKPLN